MLPPNLVQPIIFWYHLTQGHVGIERLCKWLPSFFWIDNLNDMDNGTLADAYSMPFFV